jgi:hypothetical protein
MASLNKRVFLSYSHQDRETAARLAKELLASGQDVWFDRWEIAAGDSIVRKIFAEGLANAAAFLILLSRASVRSKWVQEEMDTATVRRIEDLVRMIPVIIEDVDIPVPLRSLHWVDLRSDFNGGVRKIVNALYGVSEKPALGHVPPHVVSLATNIGGLSRLASTAALYMLSQTDPSSDQSRTFDGPTLSAALALNPIEVNDAIDELESQGLVSLLKAIGTAPYSFVYAEPTYLLYQQLASFLNYDPAQDIQVSLNAVAALGRADALTLQKTTGLPIGRLNKAIDHIKEYGLAEVARWIGTQPFNFGEVRATRRTRQESQAAR